MVKKKRKKGKDKGFLVKGARVRDFGPNRARHERGRATAWARPSMAHGRGKARATAEMTSWVWAHMLVRGRGRGC
jgi:hypothetical protein